MKRFRRLHSESLQAQENAINALREQTVALYRPYVVARMELRAGTALELVIENTGRTAAKNLRLQTDLDFAYPGSGKYGRLSEAFAFNNTIDTFAPGQRLVYLIALGSAIHQEDSDFVNHEPQFSIKATYSLAGEEGWEEMTVIDMRAFRSSIIDEPRSEKALVDIARHVDTIQKRLGNTVYKSSE